MLMRYKFVLLKNVLFNFLKPSKRFTGTSFEKDFRYNAVISDLTKNVRTKSSWVVCKSCSIFTSPLAKHCSICNG